eukprot:gene28359-31485_t
MVSLMLVDAVSPPWFRSCSWMLYPPMVSLMLVDAVSPPMVSLMLVDAVSPPMVSLMVSPALSPTHLLHMRDRVNKVVPALADGFGCTTTISWRLDEQPLYPPTVNDPTMAEFQKDVATSLLGSENVAEAEVLMAGEDFSFFCQKVPCAFAFLGIRNETIGSVHNLHNPLFKLDEGVLYKGAALHATTAILFARQFGPSASKDEL